MKHLIACCTLVACGNVTAPAADAPAADQMPPQLVSSTPAANAAGVSRLVTIQLVFDEPLDPASVTPAAFTLGCFYCSPAYGDVTYDDSTHTITLAPLFPLDLGQSYELAIGSAIHDAAGNAFAGATIDFHTRVNTITRSIQYDPNSGMPASWTGTALDASGQPAHAFGHSGAGPDATWFTSDDVISGRTEWSGTTQTQYGAAGTDGTFGTADDVVSSSQKTDNDALGNPIAIWAFDGDGHVTSLTTNDWQGRRLMGYAWHDAAGADGQWNTADDVISRFERYDYDARGRIVHEISMNAGPDQRAGTTDDTVIDYFLEQYDAQGQLVRSALIDALGRDGVAGTADDGIGPDGTWFTGDDVPYAWYAKAFDATTQTGSGGTYTGPGPDGVWFTADDIAYSHYAQTYDARRLLTSVITYDARDAITAYSTYHYDADGLYTDLTSYATPGPDRVWQTADDHPNTHYDFDDAH
jgi:hypothetical protein